MQQDSKFADLGADSLDTVEIMMALEEKFGFEVINSLAVAHASVRRVALPFSGSGCICLHYLAAPAWPQHRLDEGAGTMPCRSEVHAAVSACLSPESCACTLTDHIYVGGIGGVLTANMACR